jgi:type I restriction enzyme M protein
MNTTEQEFLKDLEKTLWTSANKLLPSLDAAVYKHVILGLVFLKYVSDAFEERHAELREQFTDPDSDYHVPRDDHESDAEWELAVANELEQRDYYAEKNVFWVPVEARWETLRDASKVPLGEPLPWNAADGAPAKMRSVGWLIDNAMDAIERENPKLKNVLHKDYARREVEDRKLGELIDLFSDASFHAREYKGQPLNLKGKDILGHVYEYFLGEFALAEGKKGGQYYTPKSIVMLMVQMLQPFRGRVYDPAMGSGGFFVQSEELIEDLGGKIGQISVYGQESNPTTWRLAAMNMAIRGIEFDFGKGPADSFTSDQHPDLRADFVMANPPFNMKEWWNARLENDPRWQYGTPPQNNANFAWLQHMLYHLAPNGTAGVVLANMSLASNDRQEESIRRKLVEADLVDCVISLPDKLFSSTPIGACIWLLRKDRSAQALPNRDILFVDASRLYAPVSRTLNRLTAEGIQRISTTYRRWVNNPATFSDEAGFSKSVPEWTVRNNAYMLFPAAYIDAVSTMGGESPESYTEQILEIEEAESTVRNVGTAGTEFLRNVLSTLDSGGFRGSRFLLGDVLIRSTERLGVRGEPEILTCTESGGIVLQRERFAKRIATEDTSEYKFVRRTDIVYNPYLLWAGAIDQCLIVEEGVTSPAYEVFRIREGFDPLLVGAALKTESMMQRYDGISVGTVKRRRRAAPERFLELEIYLPPLEQQKEMMAGSLALQKLLFSYVDLARLYRAGVASVLSSVAETAGRKHDGHGEPNA